MPTYQTLLPKNIYPFLDKMSELYSAIERDMHISLMQGENIKELSHQLRGNHYQLARSSGEEPHQGRSPNSQSSRSIVITILTPFSGLFTLVGQGIIYLPDG